MRLSFHDPQALQAVCKRFPAPRLRTCNISVRALEAGGGSLLAADLPMHAHAAAGAVRMVASASPALDLAITFVGELLK